MEILSLDYILAAFLIFVRVSSMIMTAPFFSTAAFPAQIKVFFAIVTSILLYPVIPAQNVMIETSSGILFIGLAVIMEVLVGVALGLVGQLIFAGLELAGTLISLKIALGFANVVDTMTQQQSSIISNLFTMLAILVFLSIDGDKIYLTSLAKSFEVVPIQQAGIQFVGPHFLEIATYLFIIGVQVTAPFIIVLFLLDLSLAIFARIMPQANIMFIALILKLGVGLIIMIFILPYLPVVFEIMFERLFDFLQSTLEILAPE